MSPVENRFGTRSAAGLPASCDPAPAPGARRAARSLARVNGPEPEPTLVFPRTVLAQAPDPHFRAAPASHSSGCSGPAIRGSAGALSFGSSVTFPA
ncbi:hypothetical protein HEK131_33050 [Streptomyces seoulensis]|nr:hypothetical protein HEK131_33050 [Streptomyces seoulensis]